MSSCPFCDVVAGTAPAEVVYRDAWVTAFRDRRPRAPTHVLVVPNEHIPSAAEVRAEHAESVVRLFLAAGQVAARDGLAARGYRLVINCGPDAGQSVDHLHLHVLGGRRLGWPPG